MDKSSYLLISNVITGVALIVTCGISCFRRKFVYCPFCNERVESHALRTHIGMCNQHNTLYMGRYSPTIQPLAVAVPVPPPEFMLVQATHAPTHPTNFPKIVDI
jgi:hypothetical protein